MATNNINHQNSSSAKTSTKVYKKQVSRDRVAAYLEHPLNSQILHRHASEDESIQVHTKAMKEHLDNIDNFMEELDG
ncbi:hypothetical protein IFR05_009082 [Cadophora sp. M221]|nr:hypothetical protein IFR05_009082 [Cadophora sp. M221]